MREHAKNLHGKANCECEETIARLTELDEGALRLGDALRVQLHLLHCPDCRLVRDELRALPELVKTHAALSPEPLVPLGKQALAGALARLPSTPVHYRKPLLSAIPDDIQGLLAKGADVTLRIMEMVHQAFQNGTMPLREPFLPAVALAHLPSQSTWQWESVEGAQVVRLLGGEGQPALSLLRAPRGFKREDHEHLGTEQMLILEGVLEDGESAYCTGRWVHFPQGSVHGPIVLNGECWCLIREEGVSRPLRPIEKLRRLKGA